MADPGAVVKQMQRSSPEAKEQWYAYCEAYGENVRDPAKHDSEFINTFITQFNSGARLEPSKSTQTLVQFIKLGQRKSPGWKQVWERYCDTQAKPVDGGRPKHDPMMHDSSFIEGFFDYIGRMALSGGGGVPMMGMMGEPAAKKMKGTGGMPIAMNMGNMPLVNQIKAYQKLGEYQKSNWHNYADQNLGGVRDPARHDAATLQQFVVMYGVPQASGGAVVPPVAAGAARASPRGGAPVQLVEKIKAYQKQGEQQKETWHSHCDVNLNGVRDPSRHDSATLMKFISTYGL